LDFIDCDAAAFHRADEWVIRFNGRRAAGRAVSFYAPLRHVVQARSITYRSPRKVGRT
jgi:hypothetical protein